MGRVMHLILLFTAEQTFAKYCVSFCDLLLCVCSYLYSHLPQGKTMLPNTLIIKNMPSVLDIYGLSKVPVPSSAICSANKSAKELL